ncbi:MAG: hypothetical protein DRQ88_00930 [Epsilonproteobacteria bacterium]|nr:MAG: hypothetical protein DRQ89_10090 [Campylobacterota bacterium]RLA67858.1 MAG: hypothetical protein DRQ88_00930 [Campylobacterota bacterium]
MKIKKAKNYLFLLGLLVFSHALAKPFKKEFILKGLHLNRIYKSMEGPLETQVGLDFGLKSSPFIWITKMTVEILNSDHKVGSQEFLCHAVFKYPDKNNHQAALGVAQGLKTIQFPPGHGLKIPNVKDDIFIQAQALNNNYPDIDKTVYIRFTFEYYDDETAKKEKLKPLGMKFVGSLCPYKEKNGSAGCEPVFPKYYHTSPSGKKMTDHWLVPPGKHVYSSLQEGEFAIKQDIKVHYVWMHLHPYGQYIELKKLGEVKPLWKGMAQNNAKLAILEKVESYSSVKGFNLYKDNQYELVMLYDNPRKKPVDAMGFLYMYYTPL